MSRGADSVPLAGTWVVAHAVGAERQGPLDSARSDAAGRFRFRVARPESATVYLVSARYAGVGYFSAPFDGGQARGGADSISLVVYDTTSRGPALAVGTRHVVVTRAEAGGGRRVLDVVELLNTGTATRIGADTLAPIWRMRLPEGVSDVAAGQSEFAEAAIRFEGGEVLVAAPMPPGEKQLAVTYVLPSGRSRFVIPVDQPTAQFEVLAEDSLTGAAALLERADPLVLEGRVFQRFVATGLTAGARPAVTLTATPGGARRLWWVPVLAAAALLLAGAVYARVAKR